MDEKNEELVDAQIVEEDSRMYGHAEGEPGGEVADEPALVLGDDDPHDAELHEHAGKMLAARPPRRVDIDHRPGG